MIQIIGKGGFGREVSAYCEQFNIQYFQFENECNGMRNDIGTVIAIGDEEIRSDVAEKFGSIVKWTSVNFGKTYGNDSIKMPGTIICPGTIITTGVLIGSHCLVNINCTIGHDVRIGDFVTVNPGVNISGNVTIGNNCNIGSNAVIRNGVSVCDDVIIGAGAVVVKDITEPGVYVGNPVENMKQRILTQMQKEIVKLGSIIHSMGNTVIKLDSENSLHRPIEGK